MFYIEGPGHGGQVMVSNAYLDGSYTEIYPEVTEDETGMQNYSSDFHFLEALLLMQHQKHQVLSMKGRAWILSFTWSRSCIRQS